MKKKSLNYFYHYPGDGFLYVICDICGRKVRQRDTQVITDKWNPHRNLVVCFRDYDLTNEQSIPIQAKEYPLPNPKNIRSEPPDQYLNNAINDRVPTAPQFLQVTYQYATNAAYLVWQAPIDPGSDAIQGYYIYRAVPQDTVYQLIWTTTDANTTYLDSENNDGTFASYIVVAFNSAGSSPVSNVGYYPNQAYPGQEDFPFIATSDTGDVIVTSDTGQLIVMSNGGA